MGCSLKDSIKETENLIPYGKHYLDEDDIQAVSEVLRHGWLTQGPMVRKFEESFAVKVGSKYAIAVSSGTAALHLSCLAADLCQDSKVFTSVNSFVASANCIEYVGAKTYFCDIDQDSLNMCPIDLEGRINSIGGVSAIIPVHFSGAPCDMVKIQSVAKKHNAIVIEDASHALGGQYVNGKNIGNCMYSDLTVFSLHPVKGVTSGEGGVITTNNKDLYKRLIKLRSHGIYKGNFEFPGMSLMDDGLINKKEASDEDGALNPWYYEMQELGYNYRITDIQCALALSQLNKLDLFIKRRREISKLYDKLFKKTKLVNLTQTNFREVSAHHLFVLRIDYKSTGISRSKFMALLSSQGIGTQVHYIPIPMHPYYVSRGYSIKDYPVCEKYYNEAISIPIFFKLDDTSILKVFNAIIEILGEESDSFMQ
jgi:perosamine synthetase